MKKERWLSVHDAASQMGISDANIFKKAMDGELTLSVRFITEGRGKKCTDSLTTSGEAVCLNGIYDLPMLGAERERVEIEYLNRLDDKHVAPVHIVTLKSAYVKNADGTIYELQFLLLRDGVTPSINDYRPTGELEGIQFVVRDNELRKAESGAKQSTEHTEAQQRQVELKKTVQERMQEQYDRGDSPNRKQALKDMKNSGELRRLGYYIGASIDGKKMECPEQRAYKDTHGVTIKPCSTE